MTDNTQTPLETVAEENGGRSWQFWGIAGISVTIVLCLLLFIVAVVIGVTSGSTTAMADFVAVSRDLLIILLTLQAIVIGVALVVVIVQVSALLNVLQNEINPIVESAQETVDTMRGTAEFLSKHVTEPTIKATAAIAGAREFIEEASGVKEIVDNVRGKSSTEPRDILDEYQDMGLIEDTEIGD